MVGIRFLSLTRRSRCAALSLRRPNVLSVHSILLAIRSILVFMVLCYCRRRGVDLYGRWAGNRRRRWRRWRSSRSTAAPGPPPLSTRARPRPARRAPAPAMWSSAAGWLPDGRAGGRGCVECDSRSAGKELPFAGARSRARLAATWPTGTPCWWQSSPTMSGPLPLWAAGPLMD